MDISIKITSEPCEKQAGWHILTVAESGFSMLSAYAEEDDNIDGVKIREFEERVNRSNEAGSLHPLAPISAIPCKFFRELADSTDPSILDEFEAMISDFLITNANVMQSKNLVIDFRVSPAPVKEKYIDSITRILNQQHDGVIDKVMIYQNPLPD